MDNQDAMPSLEETRIDEGSDSGEAVSMAKEPFEAKPDVVALSQEEIQKGAEPSMEMTKEKEVNPSQAQGSDKNLKGDEALNEEPPKGFLGRFFKRISTFLNEKSDRIRETV